MTAVVTAIRRALDEVVITEARRSDSAYDVRRDFVVLWCIPFCAVLLTGLFFFWTDLDLSVARLCFSQETGRWLWARAEPWQWMYNHGCTPGLVLGVGGLVVALASLLIKPLRAWTVPGFFLAAVLAVGPGLIVNGILKPSVGRPRPKEIVQFGGDRPYVPLGDRVADSASKSFPSGHASMGFYLMTPAFLLYRRRRQAAFVMLTAGLVFGGLIGAARIVQGAHFATDVLGSAACVYATALVIHLAFELSIKRWNQALESEVGDDPIILPFPTERRALQPAAEQQDRKAA